jgi:uncharacterized protein with HEPN domain
MHSKTQLALIDILDAIVSAEAFLKGLSFESFAASRLHFFAATRALEIISEASRRLAPDFRDERPQLPWRKIMGAGNVYRHNYDNVQESMVWSAIKNDLPLLRAAVEDALEDRPSPHRS